MKIDLKKIKHTVFSNPLPKILAVVVATILWMVVAASQSSTGKFPSEINIIAVNTPNGLVASYDQKTVELTISAEPSLWQKLSTNSFTAYVDLGSLGVGTYQLDVNVTCNVAGVQILNKKPEKIFVQLEEISRKKVPVIQKVEGNAAEGMVAGAITFNPAEVEVSGPKSQIENISNAIAPIKLNGESADFQKDVIPTALDDNGNEISDLAFSPSKVTADISIVKGANNKTVGVKVNLVGSPASGYFISSLSTLPSLINITGSVSALSTVYYLETQSFDISGISANSEKDILLKIPDGVGLQKGEPNKVRISIKVTSNDVSRVVSVKINPINLDSALKVTSYQPAEVKVTLVGSSEALANLNPSDVVLNLNLTGKSAGTYNLDLDNSMFTLPANVSLSTIMPTSIQVALSAK